MTKMMMMKMTMMIKRKMCDKMLVSSVELDTKLEKSFSGKKFS